MTPLQIFDALGGVVFLGVGLHAIVTRRVAITHEEESEPHLWLYGWRAVGVGCVAIAVALVFFAAAAGYVSFS